MQIVEGGKEGAAYIERIAEWPHTFIPDELQESGKKPKFKIIDKRMTLSDNGRSVEIFDLGDKSDQSQKIRLGKMLAQARDRVFTVNLAGQQQLLRIKRGEMSQGSRKWKLVRTEGGES